MSRNATNLTGDGTRQSASSYVVHVIYTLEGLGIVVGNVLILLAVALHRRFRRKEMLVVAGLAATDAFYGLGRLSTGARRLFLALDHADSTLLSAWQCLHASSLALVVGSQTQGLMMVAVSVDRYIAVAHFHTYLCLGNRYVSLLLGGIGLFGVASATVATVSSYYLTSSARRYPPTCFALWAFPDWYAGFQTVQPVVCGYLSVLVYTAVVVVYRRRVSQSAPGVRRQQLARQRKLTHTLGLVTLCTFLFHCLPFTTVFVLKHLAPDSKLLNHVYPYIFIIIGLNSLVNILIYLWRQQDMRSAITTLVCCQNWNAATFASHSILFSSLDSRKASSACSRHRALSIEPSALRKYTALPLKNTEIASRSKSISALVVDTQL